MTSEFKTIGQAASKALTAVAPSPEQSTKESNISERDHKLAFLEVFRRWEALFRRKDTGDAQTEKWVIAEYYASLGHLSPEGLNLLTTLLKEHCTFFPTIRECLDLMRPKDRYDYGHPFIRVHLGHDTPLVMRRPDQLAIGADRVARLTGPSSEGEVA